MAGAPIQATAPGKVILFGEHAVVYGQPAIAAPVTQVKAQATIEVSEPGTGLTIFASDLPQHLSLSEAPTNEPLSAAARLVLAHLAASEPDALLTLRSTIPIASGLGSGAAVSTAIMRALASFLAQPLPPAEISALVFEVEKIHHGTPSGIDNTVIAYEQPVYFIRDQPIQRLSVSQPFSLLIADSGMPSPTGEIVGRVRHQWKQEQPHYDALFSQIGSIVEDARQAIEQGDVEALGPLMDQNHELLVEMGVSSSRLEDLVESACISGALGAKLSGAGEGGNMIALVEDDEAEEVAQALKQAGALRVIHTQVCAPETMGE